MAALSRHAEPNMFSPPNSGGMGGPPGQPSSYPLAPHYQQPAPRQRTAIACRYCRRRKIRCSGFETSADGRCANCMRFNQECVFTPVSSQTGTIQAFVPAHSSLLHRSTQLYGAQGQPLPPSAYETLSYSQAQAQQHPQHQQHSQLPAPPMVSQEHQHQHQHQNHHRYTLPSPGAHMHPHHTNGEQEQTYSDDRPRHSLPPMPGHPSDAYGRRTSLGDYNPHGPQRENDSPSPSSHLSAPGLPFSAPPSSTFPPSYDTGRPPSSLSPVSGSYYPSSRGASEPQRSNSPDSHRTLDDFRHPPLAPPHQSKFHPPMLYPREESPRPPETVLPPYQISSVIEPQPHRPNPPHQQRSAADGDMLSRLNFRTGL